MSPERPRRPRRDPDRDRVKFPFGETFDGNMEDLDVPLGPSDRSSEEGPQFGSSGSRTPLPPKGADLARRTMELRIEEIEGAMPGSKAPRRDPSEEGDAFDPFESHGDTPIVLRKDDDDGVRSPQPPGFQVRQARPGAAPGSEQTLPPGYEIRRTGGAPTPGASQTLPPGYEIRHTGRKAPPGAQQTLPPGYEIRRTQGAPTPGAGQTLPPGYEIRRKPGAPTPGAQQTLPPGYEVRRGPGTPTPGAKQTLPPGYEVRRTGRPMSGPPPQAPPIAGMGPGEQTVAPGYIADGTVAPGYTADRTASPDYGRAPLAGPTSAPPPGPPMSGPPSALSDPFASEFKSPNLGRPGPANRPPTRSVPRPQGRNRPPTRSIPRPSGPPGRGAPPPPPAAPPLSIPGAEVFEDRRPPRSSPGSRPMQRPGQQAGGPPPGSRPTQRPGQHPGQRPPGSRPMQRLGQRPAGPPPGPVTGTPPRGMPRPGGAPGMPPGPARGTPPQGLPRPPAPNLDDPFASTPRQPRGARPGVPPRPKGGWESDLEASPLGEEAPELRREGPRPPKAAIDLFGSSDETPVPALYDSEDPDAVAGDSVDPEAGGWGESNTFAIEDSIDGVMPHRVHGDSQYDSMDSMDSLADSMIPDSVDDDAGFGMMIEDSGPDRPAASPGGAAPSSDAPAFRKPKKKKKGQTASDADAEAAATVKEGAVDRMVGLVTGDVLWVILSLGGALLGPILIYVAWEYYGIPAHERPGHKWDNLLRSGTSLGLWFGIGGSLLFILNLTYIARRRFGTLKKWISLRLWLNVHFLCGLTGGSLILAHSALKFDNWVARVSSAAILIAIASGLFGRYVLIHMPRRQEGESYDRADLAAGLASLRRDLRQALAPYPPLRRVALQALEQTELEEVEPKGILFVGQLILGDFKARRRTRDLEQKLRAELSRLSQDQDLEPLIDETLELVHMSSRLNRRLSQFEAVQDLMETWRAIHMILALIMVVTMVLHVTIVLTYSRISWFG